MRTVNRSFLAACLLAGALGYLSLTQEMLWIRSLSYATGSRPEVFGNVLGFFLCGVALGALAGERATRVMDRPIDALAATLIAAAIVSWLGMAAPGLLLQYSHSWGMASAYFGIAAGAALFGVGFPVLCHVALGESVEGGASAGPGIGWIYLANILGATLAPLVTGFVLLDVLPLTTLVFASGAAALVLAALLSWRRPALATGAAAGLVSMVLFHGPLFADYLARLHFKSSFPRAGTYSQLIETRSGIIAVHSDAHRLPNSIVQVIYGGGVFDGTLNVDPVNDSNNIRRAYLIAGLHPNPEAVFELGMSGGAWTAVLASYNKIKSIDVVEINPGYRAVALSNPDTRAGIAHPKVKIHFDDGRRWLNAHPEAKFDLVMMNTTFHWRAGATNVLSTDFLELVRARLRPGGVVYYNTTDSQDVAFTASAVFKYVVRYLNFIAASDSPFGVSHAVRMANLMQFERNGLPIFSAPETAGRLAELGEVRLRDLAPEYRRRTDLKLVTDDNLAVEFKNRTRTGLNPEWSWKALIDRIAWDY